MIELLYVEDGAEDIFSTALDSYFIRFGEKFPYYEYLHITQSDEYDVSIEGAKQLKKFIDGLKKPVEIPEGYAERVY